jgi:TolA-binding protein
MSGLRRGHEGDEDLVVLARRGPLDDAERRELEAALDADPALRIAHDVGRAFDDVAFVQPGDEALIARAVDRTVGKRRAVTRRWRVATAVAAGFLLAGGVAGAYRAGVAYRARRAPAVDSPAVAPPAPRARTKSHARAATEAAAPELLAAPVPPDPAPPAIEPGVQAVAPTIARPTSPARVKRAEPEERPPAPTLPATSGASTTADDLFRRAGAARRAGFLAVARSLYEDLQAQFPNTEEARLSQVSLGKLLLAMGRPAEAERHFAIYLAGGAGALAAEAAFGRAQSFERLGRSREEREAWLGLLRDFPDSVYAAAARRRIAVLENSGVSP